MNKNMIDVLEVLENGSTDLQDFSSWYSFTAVKNGKRIESFIILESETPEAEAKKLVEEHIESTNFISIGSLSPELRELVEECHGSENEMWFTEHDNEFWSALTDEELQKYKDEVKALGLENYITFGDNEYIVTVWGGISSVINFNEELEIELPDGIEFYILKNELQEILTFLNWGTIVEFMSTYKESEDRSVLIRDIQLLKK